MRLSPQKNLQQKQPPANIQRDVQPSPEKNVKPSPEKNVQKTEEPKKVQDNGIVLEKSTIQKPEPKPFSKKPNSMPRLENNISFQKNVF